MYMKLDIYNPPIIDHTHDTVNRSGAMLVSMARKHYEEYASPMCLHRQLHDTAYAIRNLQKINELLIANTDM